MLRLAVTTQAETFDRMAGPLADRKIKVEHLQTDGRTYTLGTAPDDRFDVGFVYPSRISEGAVIDAQYGIPWVNDRGAILASRNKAGVLATLDRAGIAVPQTVFVSNPVSSADIAAAIDDAGLSYPIVVKPNSTTRGIGIAKAEDPDSLSGIVDYLDLVHDFPATGEKTYLLQEYVSDARDYRAMVIDGEYMGAVERRLPEGERAEGRWKHNVHRGATAEGVSLPDEQRQIAEQTAQTLGIEYLGVDLLVSDDRTLVGETNARPTIDAATKYEPEFYDRLANLIKRTARTQTEE